MESILAAAITGVLGVIVANIDLIVGTCVMDPSQRVVCVAFCMAVLSPVMAEIGKHLDDAGVEAPKGGGAHEA